MGAPSVLLCLGAGGVGKTSTSAALALACQQAGLETLAVTLDPARRLSEALASYAPGPLLTVFEPEPRAEIERLFESLFDRETRDRMAGNRIYRAVSDALAGMDELAGVARLAEEVARRDVDVVIVDTAPSKRAVRAIGIARRVLSLVDSSALTAIARLFGRSERRGLGSRLLSWAARPVAKVLEGAVGRGPVEDIADLVGLLLRARPRLAQLAAAADQLLAADRSRFIVVTNTSDSALAAALELSGDLAVVGRSPDAFVLNRAAGGEPGWLTELGDSADLPPELATTVARLRAETAAASEATSRAESSLRGEWPEAPVWRVEERPSSAAADVVGALTRALGERALGLLALDRAAVEPA